MHQRQQLSIKRDWGPLAINPYLVIRLSPGFHHIIVLPWLSLPELLDVSKTQVHYNRIGCCLVLYPEWAYYFDVTGEETQSKVVPVMSIITGDRLKTCIVVQETDDLKARRAVFQKTVTKTGYAMGDLTKGGRDATPEELETLAGFQGDGVPKGLNKCPTCGEWRGTCLDPNPQFKGKVMEVHCVCENDNRCAWCGELLYVRKLNANYYDPKNHQIWHVPGFSALNHSCKKDYRPRLTGVDELTD